MDTFNDPGGCSRMECDSCDCFRHAVHFSQPSDKRPFSIDKDIPTLVSLVKRLILIFYFRKDFSSIPVETISSRLASGGTTCDLAASSYLYSTQDLPDSIYESKILPVDLVSAISSCQQIDRFFGSAVRSYPRWEFYASDRSPETVGFIIENGDFFMSFSHVSGEDTYHCTRIRLSVLDSDSPMRIYTEPPLCIQKTFVRQSSRSKWNQTILENSRTSPPVQSTKSSCLIS